MESEEEIGNKEFAHLIEEYRGKLSNLRIVVEDIEQMKGLTSDQKVLLKDLLDLTSTRDLPQTRLTELVQQRPRVIEETSTVLELVIEKRNAERPIQINPLNIWLSSNTPKAEKPTNEEIDIFSRYRSQLGDLVLQDLEYYIPLDAAHHESTSSNYDPDDDKNRFPLFEKGIVPFLEGKSKILLLLGDAGSGKTTSVHWLMHHAQGQIKRIPIYVDLKEYDTFQNCLKDGYGLDDDSINDLKKQPILILFDGFDEKAIDNYNIFKQHALREWPEAKCLVACRTRFLPPSHSQLFNYEGFSQFQTLYVAPFSFAQIARYIDRIVLVDGWTSQKYLSVLDENPDLKALVDNPLILKMVINALPRIMLNKSMANTATKHPRIDYLPDFTVSDIYGAFIADWFVREKEKIGKDTLQLWSEEYYTEEAFSLFCETLAFSMFLEGKLAIHYQPLGRFKSEALEKWHKFFNSKDENIVQILRGSPLSCINLNYKFYHKSFMEYFAALHIFNEIFQNPQFKLNKLAESVINQKLFIKEPAILNYLAQMISRQPKYCDLLLRIVLESRPNAQGLSVSIAADNAISILNYASFNFNSLDLSDIQAPNADLRGAYLDSANLQRANLRYALFSRAWLLGADLRQADLLYATFGEMPYLKHHSEIIGVKLRPDLNLLVSATKNIIYLWDTENSLLQRQIFKHGLGEDRFSNFSCFDMSQDANLIVTGDNKGQVQVWSRETGLVKTICEHANFVRSISMSANAEWIASCDGEIILHSPKTETKKVPIKDYYGSDVYTAIISSDGKIIVAFETEEGLYSMYNSSKFFTPLYDNRNDEGTHRTSYHDNYKNNNSLAISSDENLNLVVFGQSSDVVIVNSPTKDFSLHHESWVNCVAISQDTRLIVSGCNDATIWIWSRETERVLQKLYGHKDDITCLSLYDQKNFIASGSKDKTVRLWLLDIDRPNTRKSKLSSAIAISQNTKWIITGFNNGTADLYSYKKSKIVHTLEGHIAAIKCVSINYDGSWIVTLCRDGNVLIWLRDRGKFSHKTLVTDPSIRQAAISSDGLWIVTNYEEKAKLWSRESGSVLYEAETSGYGDIASVSPKGKWFVYTLLEDELRILCCKTQEVMKIEVGGYTHTTALFSDDEKWIIRLAEEEIILVSIETKSIIESYQKEPNSYFLSAAMSKDERWMVTSQGKKNDGIFKINIYDRLNKDPNVNSGCSKKYERYSVSLYYKPRCLRFNEDSSELMIGFEFGFQRWGFSSINKSWRLLDCNFDNPSLLLLGCNAEGALLSHQNYTLFEQRGALVDHKYIEISSTQLPSNSYNMTEDDDGELKNDAMKAILTLLGEDNPYYENCIFGIYGYVEEESAAFQELMATHRSFINYLKDTVQPILINRGKWKLKREEALKKSIVIIRDFSGFDADKRKASIELWEESLAKDKYNYLLYKIDDGWFVYGVDILGRIVERSINDFVDHEKHYKEKLKSIIAGCVVDNITDTQNEAFREILAEFFGYSRVTMIFSYVCDSTNGVQRMALIQRMASDLEMVGIRVVLDNWYSRSHRPIHANIERIEQVDAVAFFLSPVYYKSYLHVLRYGRPLVNGDRELELETSLIQYYENLNGIKSEHIRTILLDVEALERIPPLLLGGNKIYLKMGADNYFEITLRLIRDIFAIDPSDTDYDVLNDKFRSSLPKQASQVAGCKPSLSGPKKDEDYDDQSPRRFKDANFFPAINNNNLSVTSPSHPTSSSNNEGSSSKKEGNKECDFKYGAFFKARQSREMNQISSRNEYSFHTLITPTRRSSAIRTDL